MNILDLQSRFLSVMIFYQFNVISDVRLSTATVVCGPHDRSISIVPEPVRFRTNYSAISLT
jgi:hypothetical protein